MRHHATIGEDMTRIGNFVVVKTYGKGYDLMIDNLKYGKGSFCIMRQKLILILSPLILLFAAATALAAPPKNISAAQGKAMMAKDSSVFLLDVRTAGEHAQGHIEGDILIPIDQIMKRIGEIPRDRPILVYCAVGSRSSQVANYLGRLGYPRVYNMIGGISAWQIRGYQLWR